MGNYSPDAPSVLGMEWPALYARDVPLDAGIEYGQTFRSTVAETLATASPYFSVAPSASYRFQLLVNVYAKGQELATGRVQRTLVPVNGGVLGFASSLVGGATIAECLASPADIKYVLVANGGSFSVEFATAALFPGKRILRLVLHHSVGIVDPDTENPEIGFRLELNAGASGSADYGFCERPLGFDRTVQTTDLGEMHPTPPTGTVATNTERMPWTVADVQDLDTAAQRFVIETANDGFSRQIHYLALEVVWCEENRVAVGGRRYGSLDSNREAIAAVGWASVPLRTPTGAANWAKPATGEFVVTVCLADTGGPYLNAPASDMETVGPPPSTRLLDSFEVFTPHEGRAIPRGVDNEPKSADPVTALPPVALLTAGLTASPDTHPYDTQTAAPVYAGVTAAQEIAQRASAVSVAYPWVRFWARRYGDDTAPLTVTCAGRNITFTAAELDALPEIIDGWRYVTLRFATAPILTNAGTNQSVTFSSFATVASRWEILGAAYSGSGATATGPTYGGTNSAATHDGARDLTADLAVSVATAANLIGTVTATPRLYGVPGLGLICDTEPDCIPTDIGYVDLLWPSISVTGMSVSGSSVTGFDYYEVQRSDPDDTEWRTIAQVTNLATPTYPDFEAARGLVSSYRVRVVRADGTEGDWSTPVSGTPPATVGGAAGVLIFTSNIDPTRSVAYGQAFSGGPVEDFGFPEAETRTLQRLYQRDYQTAFRPTERGGTAFSRALLIGSVRPSDASATADSAFDALRDLAWDPNLPYVCVLDDLGNRWFANVNVPSGSMRRSPGVFVAQIVVTEVTDTPSTGDYVALT